MRHHPGVYHPPALDQLTLLVSARAPNLLVATSCELRPAQAGGESADAVNKALKINSVGEFGFTAIPTYFGGELVPKGADGTAEPSFEQSYMEGHGMMFTQYAMDNRGGASSDGTCGGNCDKCLHSRLFTTAIGCNIPKAKPGEEMSCVKFVKTKLPNTPYGPIDESADVKCNDTVPSAYSGWCECATKDGKKVPPSPPQNVSMSAALPCSHLASLLRQGDPRRAERRAQPHRQEVHLRRGVQEPDVGARH